MTRERGTVSLFLLGLCVMLLSLGGISLDLWRAFSERRTLAAAADAAALAGAGALDTTLYRATGDVRLVPGEAEARARASIAGQLDRRALRAVRVRADDHTVTVDVDGRVVFTLLRLLTPGGDFEISVHATAEPRASA